MWSNSELFRISSRSPVAGMRVRLGIDSQAESPKLCARLQVAPRSAERLKAMLEGASS